MARITDSTLSKVLRDRYYLGYVTHEGVEYPGRHKPLITPEVFDRVQQILEARTAANERQRKHHHYLKGSLWCGPCRDEGRESRVIVQRATGNGGTYWYFFCRGRQQHTCSQPYWDMDEVEDAVLRHYTTIRLEPEFADQVRTVLYESLADRERATKLLEQQLRGQLAKLDLQEEDLLDLAADGETAPAKVRQRLHRIGEQRQRLSRELANIDTQLDAGVAVLEGSLELLDDIQALYRLTTDEGRRLLNQAIFEKLYVGPEGIEGDEIKPPFREIITVQRAGEATPTFGLVQRKQEATEVASWEGENRCSVLLGHALSDDGSSKAVMVELGGIEPPSVERLASALRPFPRSTALRLPHRRVGGPREGGRRQVFP